jgi:hypothetical protein
MSIIVFRYDAVETDKSGTHKALKGGSDGSLYPKDRVMTAAWIIAEDDLNFPFLVHGRARRDISTIEKHRVANRPHTG